LEEVFFVAFMVPVTRACFAVVAQQSVMVALGNIANVIGSGKALKTPLRLSTQPERVVGEVVAS
jgi:hypothetical protein